MPFATAQRTRFIVTDTQAGSDDAPLDAGECRVVGASRRRPELMQTALLHVLEHAHPGRQPNQLKNCGMSESAKRLHLQSP